jgi:hypothetical protein
MKNRTSSFPRSESANHPYHKKPKKTKNPPQATHRSAQMVDKAKNPLGKGD